MSEYKELLHELEYGDDDPYYGQPTVQDRKSAAAIRELEAQVFAFRQAMQRSRGFNKGILEAFNYQFRRAESAERRLAEVEAERDRLMLEYCPQEMTLEQCENWERHQRAASPEVEAAVDAALNRTAAAPTTAEGLDVPQSLKGQAS